MPHKDSLLTYLLVVSVTGNRVSVAVFLILVILLIIICTSVAYYSLAAIFVKFLFEIVAIFYRLCKLFIEECISPTPF